MNIKGYKVIKNTFHMEKGDVLTKTGEEFYDGPVYGLYKETVTKNGIATDEVQISGNDLDHMVEEGYLEPIYEDEDGDDCEYTSECEKCKCCEKLMEIEDYVSQLRKTYKEDFDALLSEYEEGNVQPCVKVEAETVYTNMIKLLDSIDKKIKA